MKYVVLLLSLALLPVSWYLKGQSTAAGKNNLSEQYNEATRLYNTENPTTESDSTALQLFLLVSKASSNQSIAADCFIKAGNIHQTYKRYAKANELYQRAIYICNHSGKDSSLLYEACLYIGTSFYYTSIIDSSRYYFEKASVIEQANPTAKLPEKERLYNSLGALYFESADYHQSKNYFERALLAFKPGSQDYDYNYVSIKSNIATCLLSLNQPEEALRVFQSIRYRSTDMEKTVLQQMGHTFFMLNKYDSAKKYFAQAPTTTNMGSVAMLNDLGRIYTHERQWQLAEKTFDSAIAVNKRITGEIRNKEKARSLNHRSVLAEQQGLIDEALSWSNDALQELYFGFTWKKVDDLPADEINTVSHFTAFDILLNKSRQLTIKYRKTGKKELLDAALQTARFAIKTASYIKRNFDNDESRLFFNTNHSTAYYNALDLAYELLAVNNQEYYADACIEIMEGYKGNILYQNQQNMEMKTNSNIPEPVRKREKEVKQLLALYMTRMNSKVTTADAAIVETRLHELQVELSRIQNTYKADPYYAFGMYQAANSTDRIKDLQHFLDNQTALLNFAATDSVIYCLAVNSKKFIAKRITIDSGFKATISQFLRETYQQEQGKRYEGFAAGHQLYKKLINPFDDVLTGCNRLLIIPDGVMNYLPFDAFTTSPNERDYLVLSKNISYHYSFSLLSLHKNQQLKPSVGDSTLFFAPFFAKDAAVEQTGLAVLSHSATEKKNTATVVRTGNNATKQQFLQWAPHCKLLHLATHANMGGNSNNAAWIQFYPGDTSALNNRLYLPEIYNMELRQTDLVLLSACETAGGQSSSGEGLLSLSRAFLYAGSNGVVSTLWKTEDRVAAYLMQRFYTHFEQGQDAGKALQLAKKDFIHCDTIGAQYKTPNYWSNFVYLGQVHQYQKRSFMWPLLTVFLIASILGGIWLYKRKKIRSKDTI
jgi:CHAT domain-containing protein